MAVVQTYAVVESDRAFVAVRSVNFALDDIARIKKVPITVEIQNSGKSTAFIKELRIGIIEELPPIPPPLTAIRRTFPPVVAGGISQRTFGFETGWSPVVADEITGGRRKLYLYGYVIYADETFLRSRTTGFCFEYVALVGYRHPPFEACEEPAYTYQR